MSRSEVEMNLRQITTTTLLLTLLVMPASAATVRFTEVSEAAGVSVAHDPLGFRTLAGANVQDLYGPGVAIEDFNGDGLLDLFYCNGESGNRLYLNNGDWTFTESSADMGIKPSNVANGIAVADMNNTGKHDFVLGNFYDHPQLYFKGDKFGELAEQLGIVPLLPNADPDLGPMPESMGAAWGDYNEDGYVDLYIANYRDQPDVLYKSFKGSYFQYDSTVEVTSEGFGFQAMFLDYDDDGDMDIYVANDFGYNFTFMNQGAEGGYAFVDVSANQKSRGDGTSTAPRGMSMGLAVGDYDNDNDLDIYVTNFQINSLWRNDGPGKDVGFWKWEDVAGQLGVDYNINCWGVDFVDLDHDTDLDIVQASGYIWSDYFQQPLENPDQVWLNNGPDANYSFTNVTATSGFGSTMMGRGLATGDLDRDGDVDVLIGNNTYYHPSPDQSDREDYMVHTGRFQLYRNDQDFQNNWVNLKLRGQHGILAGSKANRDAIGARVWLTTTDGVTMMREIQSGASFMSHNSLEVEFGLGTADVAEIRVRWPGQEPGEEEVFSGVTANAFWRLVQGTGSGARVPVALISFGARNADRGVLLDWVSAPGIRTTGVELHRAPVAAPEDFSIVYDAQITLGLDGGQAFDPTAADGERYLYRIQLTATDGFVTLSSPVEIEVRYEGVPRISRAAVGQNFPNPFNPNTTILFDLPRDMEARLVIFDLRGRQVRTLFSGPAVAGSTRVEWDGLDDDGLPVASGVYTYALVTEDGTSARRMTLVK